MTELIPAIDIIEGRCVRLTKGDYGEKKVYDYSPLEMALRYSDCGIRRIHLVDLDGAKASKPVNLKILEQLSSALSIELEWGGGISCSDALASVFSAGATHAIIGSVAALNPGLFSEWLRLYGKKMILGADVRNGMVSVKAWTESAGLKIDELIGKFLDKGLSEVICTDINRDGMLKGPSFELYTTLKSRFPLLSLTVSGGISSMDDIRKADSLGLDKVIVGKAIYENRITLEDLRLWSQKG